MVFLILLNEDELDWSLFEEADSLGNNKEGLSFFDEVAVEDTGENMHILFDFLQLEQVPEPGMPMSHLQKKIFFIKYIYIYIYILLTRPLLNKLL